MGLYGIFLLVNFKSLAPKIKLFGLLILLCVGGVTYTVKNYYEKQEQISENNDIEKNWEAGHIRECAKHDDTAASQACDSHSNRAEQTYPYPPEFFQYQRLVRSSFKKVWNWYDPSPPLTAAFSFSIEPNGKIRDVQLVESSGNKAFDDSVVRAAKKASPLPPPPESVYRLFKNVKVWLNSEE